MKMRDLEAKTGVNRETIRVYFRKGLLPEPARPARNVADYSDEHVRAINAVRKLQRESGLTLAQISKIIVVDLGTDMNEMTRPVLEQADRIVVCLRPERVALSAARQLINHLKSVVFPHVAIDAVMVDFGQDGMQLPRTAVEGFLGHPLLAIITIPPAEMTRAVNKAQPLVYLSAQTQSGAYLRQLAQQLVYS